MGCLQFHFSNQEEEKAIATGDFARRVEVKRSERTAAFQEETEQPAVMFPLFNDRFI